MSKNVHAHAAEDMEIVLVTKHNLYASENTTSYLSRKL